jgi:hypothetical protein
MGAFMPDPATTSDHPAMHSVMPLSASCPPSPMAAPLLLPLPLLLVLPLLPPLLLPLLLPPPSLPSMDASPSKPPGARPDVPSPHAVTKHPVSETPTQRRIRLE